MIWDLQFVEDGDVLFDQKGSHPSDLADEVGAGIVLVTGTDAMKIFQIAVNGSLGVLSFKSHGARVFAFGQGFADNQSFMRDTGTEVLQAARMGQHRRILFFPLLTDRRQATVLPPGKQADIAHRQQRALLLGFAGDPRDGALSNLGHAGSFCQPVHIGSRDQGKDDGNQFQSRAIGTGPTRDSVPKYLARPEMVFGRQLTLDQFGQFFCQALDQ